MIIPVSRLMPLALQWLAYGLSCQKNPTMSTQYESLGSRCIQEKGVICSASSGVEIPKKMLSKGSYVSSLQIPSLHTGLCLTLTEINDLVFGRALPNKRLIIGGPLHGTIKPYVNGNYVWHKGVGYKKVVVSNGEIDTVVYTAYNVTQLDRTKYESLAYLCSLVGIGFNRQYGQFELVSLDKFCKYEIGDEWACAARLAYKQMANVLIRIGEVCDEIKRNQPDHFEARAELQNSSSRQTS